MPKSNLKNWKGKFHYDIDKYLNDKEYRDTVEYTKLLIKILK